MTAIMKISIITRNRRHQIHTRDRLLLKPERVDTHRKTANDNNRLPITGGQRDQLLHRLISPKKSTRPKRSADNEALRDFDQEIRSLVASLSN